MKNTLRKLRAAFRRAFTRAIYLANETKAALESLFLPNAFTPGKDNWVQLSPFGDFGNKDAKGNRVIQRFRKEDAEHICNEFNGLGRKITQPLGMPFYVGHPDHARFKGQPGHTDTAAKGRGKEMAVRHDAGCAACQAFANSKDGKASVAPCAEHGLFVKMHWNPDGEELITNEAFHGHSVNWAAVPDGKEAGAVIMRPIRVKSTGFTNEPNIPVTPAQLANEEEGEEVANADGAIIPPKLKLIAGFKENEDVTMEQIIAALEKAKPAQVANEGDGDLLCAAMLLANDADGDNDAPLPPWVHEAAGTDPKTAKKEDVKAALTDKATKAGHMDRVKRTGDEMRKAQDKHYKARAEMEQALANEKAARTAAETNLANERKARATLIVEPLVKAGKVVLADKDKRIEELCNAGDEFDAKVAQLANSKPVVKTQAVSAGLGGKNTVLVAHVRERTQKFEALMQKREQELPNEAYQDRYEAVANSAEGVALFASMQRANAPQDKKD